MKLMMNLEPDNSQYTLQKGKLLISEPFLSDPNFERSVILLCDHNETESVGFVLNKPTVVSLEDVTDELGKLDKSLYVGGPVEQNTLHYIHKLGETLEGSEKIIDNIYWGGNFEQLKFMIDNHLVNPEDIKFFLGYSGWGEQQLEDELEKKAWIITDADEEDVFNTDSEMLWRSVLNKKGGKYKAISNYPIDPRLN